MEKLKILRMDYNNWKTLKPIQTPAGMYGDTHDPFADHSERGFNKASLQLRHDNVNIVSMTFVITMLCERSHLDV